MAWPKKRMTTHISINSTNRINYNNTNPANCEISLNRAIFANCAELSYFMTPNTFYNVTSKNNTFLLNAGLITVDPGCYSLTDLTTELLSLLPAGTTLLYNAVTNQIELTFLVATTLDFSISRFYQILGFKKKAYGPSTVFISEQPPKIYQTNIFIRTNMASNIVNDLGNRSTFIVPICQNRGEMITFHNRTMFSSRPKVKGREIKNISFVLTDEYGEILEGAGEFTIVLAVEEEIRN